jgi:hypothetical protein
MLREIIQKLRVAGTTRKILFHKMFHKTKFLLVKEQKNNPLKKRGYKKGGVIHLCLYHYQNIKLLFIDEINF